MKILPSKLRNVGNFLRNDITTKIIFTLLMVVVFRAMASIPLPGINLNTFHEVLNGNALSNIFTVISGGNISRPSLVAIGVAPYINASIIIQLLTTVIPKLEDLSKEGQTGRDKINQITRLLALPLAFLQSVMIHVLLTSENQNFGGTFAKLEGIQWVAFVLSLTAGSMLLMWLGEQITEKGVGNGASLIIAVGIIANIPGIVLSQISGLASNWSSFLGGNVQALASTEFRLFYVVILIVILMVVFITFVNEAMKKVPIRHARRYRADNLVENYLPLKLNQSGVMPVIFAQAMLTFPLIISTFIVNWRHSGRIYDFATSIVNANFFKNRNWEYELALVLLIIVFAYFYTYVVVKPDELAKNLQRSGAFVPGVRPGTETIKYINDITLKLTLFGALFLGIITTIPYIFNFFNSGSNNGLTILSGLGGTSLLIVVSVFMDVFRKLESLKSDQNYELYK
jgi:preprotein translocase subunit SecY